MAIEIYICCSLSSHDAGLAGTNRSFFPPWSEAHFRAKFKFFSRSKENPNQNPRKERNTLRNVVIVFAKRVYFFVEIFLHFTHLAVMFRSVFLVRFGKLQSDLRKGTTRGTLRQVVPVYKWSPRQVWLYCQYFLEKTLTLIILRHPIAWK